MIQHSADSIDKPGRADTLEAIQYLRAFAALMVAVYHLSSIEEKYGHGLRMLGKWTEAGQFGVDLFFSISGYIMMQSTYKNWGKIKKAPHFLARRLLRIYPIYWQFLMLVIGVWLWRPEWVNGSLNAQPDLFKSFMLLPQSTPPMLAVGWSLVHELYFYLVMILVFLFPPRAILALFCLWATITAALYLTYHGSAPTVQLLASPFTLEFIIGALAGWLGLHNTKHFGRLAVYGALLVFLAIGLGAASWADDLLRRALTVGLASGAMVYLAGSAKTMQGLWNKLMVGLGDASYSLYLSHVLVLSAIGRIWHSLGNENMLLHCIWLLGALVLTSVLAMLNYQLVENPIHAYVKRRFP